MANISFSKESIFVLDKETFGIYYVTSSIIVAKCLSEGLLDSYVRIVRTSESWVRDKLFANVPFEVIKNNSYENSNQLVFNRITKEEIIFPLPLELNLEKFQKLKKLALLRASYFEALEKMCEAQLGRVSSYLNFIITPLIRTAVSKIEIEPTKNTIFPSVIEEYAMINEITPLAAFNELKMKMESADLIHIRNYAFFIKYTKLYNNAKTKEECENIFKEFINDLFLKATV